MSRDLLYRNPISDAYSLDDIKWQRECPEIAWDETTVNKYLYYIASGATSDVLDVSVMNPNPLNIWTSDKYEASDTVRGGWDVNKDHLVHPEVEFVRVQFRRPGIGEWISAWDDSKASGCDLRTFDFRVWFVLEFDQTVLHERPSRWIVGDSGKNILFWWGFNGPNVRVWIHDERKFESCRRRDFKANCSQRDGQVIRRRVH